MDKPPKRIDINEKQKVEYCIPGFLRDLQIKQNCERVKGRIAASYEPKKEPIALVNYGPSLNDTWEEIKKFKYIMTCSGAHKFLVERGIIPTHHIDVDPREHKVTLMGQPQQACEYLIASTCHPKLIEHLKGFNIRLWHIFDTSEDGFRLLPPQEWAITGGCSVGVRTITLARFLGFTDLHIFGMDGCYGESGRHAAAHPNQTKEFWITEYEGKEYKTSPAMLEAVKNTWHELDQLKDVKTTFYGKGLVQDMAKGYKRKETNFCTYAFTKKELISSSYVKLNEQLHENNLLYGVGGKKHAPTVLKLTEQISKQYVKKDKPPFVSVLDYGCGKGFLAKELPFPIYEYDPAIPGKTESPRPADLVVCTDVLEHIEPDHLDQVLDDIRRCTKNVAFFAIHTGQSSKTLADGRNSHLIVEGKEFWKDKLSKFFVIPEGGFTEKPPILIALVAARHTNKFTKMEKLEAA